MSKRSLPPTGPKDEQPPTLALSDPPPSLQDEVASISSEMGKVVGGLDALANTATIDKRAGALVWLLLDKAEELEGRLDALEARLVGPEGS